MGACCSKADGTITSTPTPPELKIKPNPQQPEKKKTTAVAIVASPTEQRPLNKDVFVAVDRHPDQVVRKSIDRKKNPNSGTDIDISVPATTNSAGSGSVVGATVRTSSCTKEEVDAILIQCGRLSRSSSGVKPAGGETPARGRRSPATTNPRVPLSEIDTNAKPNGEKTMNNKPNNVKNSLAKETQMVDDTKTNQIVSRTRSLRLSRDLDINPNPNPPSYASLLLEDIQNFHQKIPNGDDLMEASLHKYVTVRRGGEADTDDKESSGSNSFAGSQQLSWMSSSWEPNSGDSTDCWTSKSRSDAGDMGVERNGEYSRNGIGRGRVGVHGRSAYSLPNNAAVDSM
ncbi:hypothetical protein L1987_74671 [Smallanthus sonchifolius]|uniref:Uncharacterized protein n=1 Tax=Smallanthus sonchifolius TaxID=185202 RepID=A0ACB9A386_9ASTR|nr:hypothetical protein L1987_74671 [Smallanthus sonchifolius]